MNHYTILSLFLQSYGMIIVDTEIYGDNRWILYYIRQYCYPLDPLSFWSSLVSWSLLRLCYCMCYYSFCSVTTLHFDVLVTASWACFWSSLLTMFLDTMSYKPSRLFVKGVFMGYRRLVYWFYPHYLLDLRFFRTPTSISLRLREWTPLRTLSSIWASVFSLFTRYFFCWLMTFSNIDIGW